MKNILRSSVILLLTFAFITGFLYPMLITAIAQVVFPWQANGSILKTVDGKPIGSHIIGQSFQDPRYFWSRPSATSDSAYNAGASGGSNLSVLNETLSANVNERITHLYQYDTVNNQPIPIDLITASASGLDPHITPEAALFQVPRVAHVRGLPEKQVRDLVMNHVERPIAFLLENRELCSDTQSGT